MAKDRNRTNWERSTSGCVHKQAKKAGYWTKGITKEQETSLVWLHTWRADQLDSVTDASSWTTGYWAALKGILMQVRPKDV